MHYALTAVVIAASFIAVVAAAMGGLYHYVPQISDAPASALQAKAAEIGYLLSAGQDGAAYGVPVGRSTMSSVRIDPFNVTLQLPEGPFLVQANKTALAVQGVVMGAPPQANFSWGGGSRVFASGSAAYIMPLMKVVSVTTEAELGAPVHLILLEVPSIQQGFSATGTFNVMRRTLGTASSLYERSVGAGGNAVLYIDGDPALQFQVQAGDKVRIEVIYNLIQLVRIG